MMDIILAVEKIADIKEYCKTDDIFAIYDKLGIPYLKRDLGSPRDGLKGFSTYYDYHFCSVINQRLPRFIQILVAYHELGHIILDPELLMSGTCLFDYNIGGSINAAERRANLFAAEGLIDDKKLLNMLHSGYTLQSAASALKVPEEFVTYKVKILRQYDEPLPYVDMPDSRCLGDDILGGENF